MGSSKKNPIVILRGKKNSVFPSDKEARPFYSHFSRPIFYKCGTVESGMRDLLAFQKWESLAPEFKQRNVGKKGAQEIIKAMLVDEERFIAEQLTQVQAEREEKAAEEERMRNAPTMEERSRASSIKATEQAWARIQTENERKKKHVILTCQSGTGGNAATVTHSDGTVHVVQTTPGVKAPQKRLELARAAMKLAEDVINAGADAVDILGLDASVISTLTDWAVKARTRGWLNSASKPFANRDLVEPMLEQYEKHAGKITLGGS